ncbi:MAG: poly-gamma-glutamate system protein [candidate division KSB1 bacterium]|nr:poly-gamma-glutamate system protein [candidate division KSB1 bacterium]
MVVEAISIGMLLCFIHYGLFGAVAWGTVVPGRIAPHLSQPGGLACHTAGGFCHPGRPAPVVAAPFLVWGCAFIAAVVVGFLLRRGADALFLMVPEVGAELRIIGYIIPPLIAYEMFRQGVVATLRALTIVAVTAKLVFCFTTGHSGSGAGGQSVMRGRRIRTGHLALNGLLLLACFCLFLVHATRRLREHPDRGAMCAAARRMQQCVQLIDACAGGGASARLWPGAIIGEEYTPLTTTLGSIEAKIRSANPHFAALVVRLLREAGVDSGDVVAMGFSGSFPALCIAAITGAEALGARPVVISSIGASSWGANRPHLIWLDMERILCENNLIATRSVLATIGAEADTGGGLSDQGRAMAREAARRTNVELLLPHGLQASVAARLRRYQAAGKIKAFVNVGGSQANVGPSCWAHTLRPELVLPTIHRPIGCCGLAHRFLALGVPVIHLPGVRELCARYGLPYGPPKTAAVGKGSVCLQPRYPTGALWASLGTLSLGWLAAGIPWRHTRASPGQCDSGFKP